MTQRGNIASYLSEVAAQLPFHRAVVLPQGRDADGRRTYSHVTFAQLNADCDMLAHGLQQFGITRGTRTLLFVKPGPTFFALTFALFKVGAIPVLLDPGMGRKNLLDCIARSEPGAMIAVPLAHAVRTIVGGKAFASVRHHITVGRRWFWGGATLDDIRRLGLRHGRQLPFFTTDTNPTDPAAILFTSGSTGPPKGVVYEHSMFIAQVEMLREAFHIGPGDLDLPGLPLFGLFSTALGATAVIPDLDFSRPATVNPATFIETLNDHGVTYSFGSPAIWHRVTAFCLEHHLKLPSLRLVLMAGAPVPWWLVARFRDIMRPDALTVTPYGATECLPATLITGAEILEQTADRTRRGEGYCVGRPFPQLQMRLIKITDDVIPHWRDDLLVPPNQPGEICFAGPVTTKEYFRAAAAQAQAKIYDPATGRVWHRMGDVGAVDDQGRLWFYGRKAHLVRVGDTVHHSVRCEAIFEEHPDVFRAALVGVGVGASHRPVIVIEPKPGKFPRGLRRKTFTDELLALAAQHPLTATIQDVLFHPAFPVDVRHNAKINREALATWAANRV